MSRLSLLRSSHPWLFGLAAALALSACSAPGERSPQTGATPPDSSAFLPELAPPLTAPRDFAVESPHGTRNDPYYWLRDDSRKNPEMLAYLEAENRYFEAGFAPFAELQQSLYKEMRARIKEDDSSVPVLDGDHWYYTRFEPGQQYPIVARRKGSMERPESILLDGNERAKGSNFYQLGNWEVSEDGNILAVAEDRVGRRQYTLSFLDLRSGQWLPERFENTSGNMVFANDSRHVFFVEQDPQTLLPYRVRRHELGLDPKLAITIYEEKDNTFLTFVGRFKSDQMLYIGVQSTVSTEWHTLPANEPTGMFKVFLPRERDHEYQVEQVGNEFLVRSNYKAPNFRIFRVDPSATLDRARWRELVPHREDVFIQDIEVYRDVVAVSERSGGLRKIRTVSLRSFKQEHIAADEPAYTMWLSPTPNLDSGKLRYVYTSLTTPTTTYELDLGSGERTQLKRDPVLGDFDPARYQSEFLMAPARDGAKVPVSVVYRKDTPRDGSAPILISAYGSYGLSRDPSFSSARLSLLDRGFVFALAHIRGGQELGREWYDQGRMLNKKNTFNDYVDVTDFLVREGYAAKDQVYGIGGSAGGLLMGAVVNQAPERYRGIVSHVPFVDVVTTMLDETIPLTTGEFDEWGNPKQQPYYDYMLSYSPYDQLRRGAYPAMLITTGLYDSQVQYWEPAKYVAKLRTLKTDRNPLLFKINMEAGHGGRSGRFEQLEETARDFAFIVGLAGKGG